MESGKIDNKIIKPHAPETIPVTAASRPRLPLCDSSGGSRRKTHGGLRGRCGFGRGHGRLNVVELSIRYAFGFIDLPFVDGFL